MSKIFEAFGYRIDDHSPQAQSSRRHAWCPFMNAPCDGGGNRHLSNINFQKTSSLQCLFPKKTDIPSGVCSLQIKAEESPWIVCPRRLLFLGRSNASARQHQAFSESLLLKHAGYAPGTVIGVWPEVKMKYAENAIGKSFDYTFDYVIMPVGTRKAREIEKETGMRWEKLHPLLQKAGYTLTMGSEGYQVEDFPFGDPCIVEIMTSSTSGGNKKSVPPFPWRLKMPCLENGMKAPASITGKSGLVW